MEKGRITNQEKTRTKETNQCVPIRYSSLSHVFPDSTSTVRRGSHWSTDSPFITEPFHLPAVRLGEKKTAGKERSGKTRAREFCAVANIFRKALPILGIPLPSSLPTLAAVQLTIYIYTQYIILIKLVDRM